MTSADLFNYVPPPAGDPINDAFRSFHEQNPRVYMELVKLARDLKRRGHEHYGIAALFEVIRYHRALETTDPDFKLNNNYRALYARMIMRMCPDLAGFFSTREREIERKER